jgi:hypothetical protein
MYAGVPASERWVSAPVTSPKSVTRGRPSAPTRMFSGLTSRWTSPAACAAARPRPAATKMPRISRQSRGRRSQARRVSPSIRSIAMKSRSSRRPTS